jgi:uncharacterized protein YijF (DUF1287 family)
MKIIKFTFLFIILTIPNWISAQEADFYTKLSHAAIDITKSRVIYDPAYVRIPYPNGDVPSDRGVCTDVIIRAYRKLGIDLQEKVHVDMKANFDKYPSKRKWGLKSTDTNIDHRRVPNLETFFSRKGIVKPITNNADDYQAGDIVSWTLDNGLAHIGIVVDKKSKDQKRPLVVHNIGRGQVVEDCLFSWKIVGHYRYK